MDPLMPTSDAFSKNEKTAAHTESNACKVVIVREQQHQSALHLHVLFRKIKEECNLVFRHLPVSRSIDRSRVYILSILLIFAAVLFFFFVSCRNMVMQIVHRALVP